MQHPAFDWLAQHRQAMVEDCKALCAIPSVEDAAQPGAPFGAQVRRALDWALQQSQALGLEVYNDDGYAGHAQTTLPADGQPFAVLAHLDVVPANPADWATPPFTPTLGDGKLFARGSIDNKGPAIAVLYAVAALQATQPRLARPIRLIFGCDEESGWQDIDHYRQTVGLPEDGFAPDAAFPVINAEKGIVWAKMAIAGADDPCVRSFNAGLRPNMVPDTAVALVTPADPAALQAAAAQAALACQPVEYNGTPALQITANGIAAHGSTPQEGKNAAVILAEFLLPYAAPASAMGKLLRLMTTVQMDGRGMGLQCADQPSGALTVNVGVVDAQPGSCTTTWDIRYPVTADWPALLAQLQQAIAPAELQIVQHQLPLYLPANDPLVQTLTAIYNQHTGTASQPIGIGGGTYARALAHGVAFGPLPNESENLAHQADEYIGIDCLYDLAQLYLKALLALCA